MSVQKQKNLLAYAAVFGRIQLDRFNGSIWKDTSNRNDSDESDYNIDIDDGSTFFILFNVILS